LLVRGRWRDAQRAVRTPLHKFATAGGERRVRVSGSRSAATTNTASSAGTKALHAAGLRRMLAYWHRKPERGLIMHSDRGSQ
jgi:hypothetical protein